MKGRTAVRPFNENSPENKTAGEKKPQKPGTTQTHYLCKSVFIYDYLFFIIKTRLIALDPREDCQFR